MPVVEARRENLPSIFGADRPFMPFSRMKPRMTPSSSLAHTTNTSAIGELVIQFFEPACACEMSPRRKNCEGAATTLTVEGVASVLVLAGASLHAAKSHPKRKMFSARRLTTAHPFTQQDQSRGWALSVRSSPRACPSPVQAGTARFRACQRENQLLQLSTRFSSLFRSHAPCSSAPPSQRCRWGT